MTHVINPKLFPLLKEGVDGSYATVSKSNKDTVTLTIDAESELTTTINKSAVAFADGVKLTTEVKANLYNVGSYWYFNDQGLITSIVAAKVVEPPKAPSGAGRGCMNTTNKQNW